jgi:hypothetical protein
MISTALCDQVVDAFADGDHATLERLAREGMPVMVVLFVSAEGGGVIRDDMGLLERIGCRDDKS